MRVSIKVTQYQHKGRTWFRWLLRRAGVGGQPIARCVKPFTGAYIANMSANRMGDLMREAGCEVEVVEAVYKQPENMRYSKRPPKRIVKIDRDSMKKYGISVC